MSEPTTHVKSLHSEIDTSSDEFKVAQAHMSLREQLERHGVADETIDMISEDTELAIESHTDLNHREIREIENVFLEIWYPKLGNTNV